MKKILVLLSLVIAIGTGVGYAMLSSSASSDIPADRYGEFEVYEADDVGLMEYIIEYDYLNEELKTLDMFYAFILDSTNKNDQYETAMNYVENYIGLQERIYTFNDENKVPSEFKKLHESMIKEIGIADLITEEFDDAIQSEDFSKVDALMEKSKGYREEGLASTDRIEYFKEAGEFILKD